MERLNEHDVALSFIGKSVDHERVAEVFDEGKYVCTAHCLHFDENLCKKFKITHALHEKWMYGGVDFRIKIEISNHQITDCGIFKYKDPSGGSCGRPQGGEVSPNQQEIKIFERILEYVTRKKEEEKMEMHIAKWQNIYVNADSENGKITDIKSGDMVCIIGMVKKRKGCIYIDNCKYIIADSEGMIQE